ncbi:EF-hand domain-containing protein, partial [Singulisphaera rosea]
MRTISGIVLTCGILSVAAIAQAQPPGAKPDGDLVTRMMEFDADKSGTLTKAEITDDRLIRLFGRADTNKDGTVTKAELAALEAKEESNDEDGPPGFGPPGGP